MSGPREKLINARLIVAPATDISFRKLLHLIELVLVRLYLQQRREILVVLVDHIILLRLLDICPIIMMLVYEHPFMLSDDYLRWWLVHNHQTRVID